MTVANCMNKDGLQQATALSIVFGLSFEKYNKTTPHEWILEAQKVVNKYQDFSQYWNVRALPGITRSCTSCRAMARRTRWSEAPCRPSRSWA